ncbi:hypothetical protein C2G38_2308258 [Gigaspora rosea]|uniref:Uncharacterized protein n=1 Tax=Gigaspora rosea TaxID=44941 RepID=A0A397V9D3_9GLOM|nr:hypothetical protein C2G38_2308258 [Gigaspora rosea]
MLASVDLMKFNSMSRVEKQGPILYCNSCSIISIYPQVLILVLTLLRYEPIYLLEEI